MKVIVAAISLYSSFAVVWWWVHRSPPLPKMNDGTPYHPRVEVWKTRENGYTSDSGSSGPYR